MNFEGVQVFQLLLKLWPIVSFFSIGLTSCRELCNWLIDCRFWLVLSSVRQWLKCLSPMLDFTILLASKKLYFSYNLLPVFPFPFCVLHKTSRKQVNLPDSLSMWFHWDNFLPCGSRPYGHTLTYQGSSVAFLVVSVFITFKATQECGDILLYLFKIVSYFNFLWYYHLIEC